MKGFEFTQWLAILAPADTPQPVIARLNGALREALKTKDVREKFEAQAFVPFPTTPEEARKFLAEEAARLSRVIKARGITAD